MLRPSYGDSKAKKLAVMVELANAKYSAPDVSPDLHDREFLRRGWRLSHQEFRKDHVPDAREQRVSANEERGVIQEGVS